jgi:DNA repair exonuclease SbcCD ATPase subunit
MKQENVTPIKILDASLVLKILDKITQRLQKDEKILEGITFDASQIDNAHKRIDNAHKRIDNAYKKVEEVNKRVEENNKRLLELISFLDGLNLVKLKEEKETIQAIVNQLLDDNKRINTILKNILNNSAAISQTTKQDIFTLKKQLEEQIRAIFREQEEKRKKLETIIEELKQEIKKLPKLQFKGLLSPVGSAVSAKWGQITGNLSDQKDLSDVLNQKVSQTEAIAYSIALG